MRLLFNKVDLGVKAGDALWVRGPNGQGKTSLLRLLAGLSKAEAGEVELSVPQVYIGHQHALKDELSATEALRFLVRLHGGPDDAEAIEAALLRLGVKARRHALVRTLSQGQRRRVALSRLALSPPGAVWLLDEPFDALDDQGVQALIMLIQDHREAGGALVFTSHQAVNLPGVRQLHLHGPDRS
jgi:heme exporter protein A